jgi:glycosyltransferase involved in cell wall biosynthesis
MIKRILIFSTAYFPFVGGAEIAIKELTDRLSGLEFDMVTARLDSKLPQAEKIGNVNVYRVGIGLSMFDKYYLAFFGKYKALALNKKNKYDLIWAMMASYGGFAAMFFKSSNKCIPFLLTLQEGDPFEYIEKRAGFLSHWFKKIFKSADRIQCISHYLSDWARAMGARSDIAVIPNGVDLNKFFQEFPVNELLQLKAHLGIKEGEKLVIHAGRVVVKNGLRYVIEALPHLPENVKFLIMGDGNEKESCEKIVNELNLSERVIFFGKYDNKVLPAYLKISDVFIRPSLSEGQGISFLEAMAAGIPIIGTAVGGIPDFLTDNETGWFCREKDPESIAEKISYILDEKNKIEVGKIVENAKKLIRKHYDWLDIAKDMEKIFNNDFLKNND